MSGRTLYLMWLLSAFGLLRLGEGETLLSESDSETGLRGRDPEEDCGAFQLPGTGEARGLGSVETPDRTLYLSESIRSRLPLLAGGGELLLSDSDSEGTLRLGRLCTGGLLNVERTGDASRDFGIGGGGSARVLCARRSRPAGRDDLPLGAKSESRSEMSSSSELSLCLSSSLFRGLSSTSGMLTRNFRLSRKTTIVSFPLDFSTRCLVSSSDRFSVVIPLIFRTRSPSCKVPSLDASPVGVICLIKIWLPSFIPYSSVCFFLISVVLMGLSGAS